MKILMIVVLLGAFVAVDAQTYRAGGTSRARFGAAAQEQEEEASAPGASSSIKTRTFSNYSSRQREWSKGVQTQPVQTQTAGSKDFDQKAAAQAAQAADAVKNLTGAATGNPAPAAKVPSGKSAAPAPAANGGKANSKPDNQQAPAANTAPAAAQMQEASAMMQQVQGMMKGLNDMMGSMGGGNAGAGSNANASAGMPDVSALLNAASAGQQPAKK